ncbi:hypothetical protein CJ030_MR4G022485 [Morella rubra]|uniref:PGG domain-containing protein n=1 Tax=Morella rubra TaxID=262757 RepID=A0A6A1VSW7_9ROSI|nr:hypothetical protein CJ030_MR4G022492 [Morella rubra]KAB1216034.1 hypothetical protein CJ030_MR4G022485 [Morella rubra]
MEIEAEKMETGREVEKQLIENALKGKWDKIVEIYKSNPAAYEMKINKSGDTALHLAVSDGKVKIVKELIAQRKASALPENDQGKASALPKNDQGNTPLHVAASMGNVAMCKALLRLDPPRGSLVVCKALLGVDPHRRSLVGCKNEDGETPFFLAAFYGREDAFLYLHEFCTLHELDATLAFQIIGLYKELVYSKNEQGISPLHILAAKPTAFNSGSRLGLYEKILYQFTEEKKNGGQIDAEDPENRKGRDQEWLPANYDTCYAFFKLGFKGIILTCYACFQLFKGILTVLRLEWLPANYGTCYAFFKLGLKGLLIVLGLGYATVKKIEEKKRKHTWAFQVMKELLPDNSSANEYAESVGQQPSNAVRPVLEAPDQEIDVAQTLKEVKTTIEITTSNGIANRFVETIQDIFPVSVQSQDKKNIVLLVEKDKHSARAKQPETPILIAAKNGVTEIVGRILNLFPAAIHDTDEDGKNVVLLAVENRQPQVFQFFLDKEKVLDKDSVFRKVDKEGNSALHLAGKLGDYKPWRIPGEALQMQWELKWYEFVKGSMSFHFYTHFNKQGKTSKEVFNETHKELVKSGGEWLTKTSESCSVVAALIATVAFATSATIPGGVKSDTGTPLLERKPAFDTFAISSLIALCFSVTALVMFLAILTSRFQPKDFGTDLPRKLFIGLTSLLVSIAAVLISFCAGHFFVLKHRLGYWALPVYAVACLPISFYGLAQFSLYIDVMRAILKKVPQRSYSSATGPS